MVELGFRTGKLTEILFPELSLVPSVSEPSNRPACDVPDATPPPPEHPLPALAQGWPPLPWGDNDTSWGDGTALGGLFQCWRPSEYF